MRRAAAACALLVLLGAAPHLDLPIAPPRSPHEPQEVPPPPAEEEPDADDPRDAPPPVFYGEEIDAARESLVYVLDVSGSMVSTGLRAYDDPDRGPWRGTRLDRAVAELVRSIRGLSANLEFSVVVYNCSVTPWTPGLVEATEANKASACAWARGINWANGGTGTGPGTSYALSYGADAVVLLTDGEPNCGALGTQAHRRMIAQANWRGVPVHVFGVEAVGEWRGFCQGVAADSGGRYVDVP